MESEDDFQTVFQTMFEEDSPLRSHFHDIKSDIIKIMEKLDEKDEAAKEASINSVMKILQDAKDVVKAAKSDDWNAAAQAFMDFSGICAEVVAGPEGLLLVSFVSLFVSLLSSGGEPPGGDLLAHILKTSLDKYQNADYREKIAWWEALYESANSSLIGIEKSEKLTKETWHSKLEQNVPDNIGVQLLGEISEFLHHTIIFDNVSGVDDAYTVMQFANDYCRIVFCRANLLFRKYRLLLIMGGEDLAAPAYEDIKPMFSTYAGKKLEFLYRPLGPRGALVASLFKRSSWKAIDHFFSITGMDPPIFKPVKSQPIMVQKYSDAYLHHYHKETEIDGSHSRYLTYVTHFDMTERRTLCSFMLLGHPNQYSLKVGEDELQVKLIVTADPNPLCLLASITDPTTFLKAPNGSQSNCNAFSKLPETEVTTDFFWTLEIDDDQQRKFITSEHNSASKQMFRCVIM